MLVYGECECFVMQVLYVCILCAPCGSSQCCILHELQFVNAGPRCNRRPYRRGILQSRSHNCFIGSHECLLLFTPSCCSAFMICRGLCACTEMLWMCVLYVSFGSKIRPRTFGCVAMGSALLFIVSDVPPPPMTRGGGEHLRVHQRRSRFGKRLLRRHFL